MCINKGDKSIGRDRYLLHKSGEIITPSDSHRLITAGYGRSGPLELMVTPEEGRTLAGKRKLIPAVQMT